MRVTSRAYKAQPYRTNPYKVRWLYFYHLGPYKVRWLYFYHLGPYKVRWLYFYHLGSGSSLTCLSSWEGGRPMEGQLLTLTYFRLGL